MTEELIKKLFNPSISHEEIMVFLNTKRFDVNTANTSCITPLKAALMNKTDIIFLKSLGRVDILF